MELSDVLRDAFGRVVEHAEAAVDGLDADSLAWRPDAEANPIGWLIWHLTRVQDDHVSELARREQVWTDDGFEDRFGFGLAEGDIGYGHTSDDVARVRPDGPDLLLAYLTAVTDRTGEYLDTLRGRDVAELDRIVDRRWDPPVSAGVRLVSVLDDCTQHAGQAAYVRGLLDRARPDRARANRAPS